MSHEDLAPDPVHPVTARLVNDDDETYFVKIAMERDEAGELLRSMWRAIDGVCFPNDGDDALCEWTDRMRGVRSTFSDFDGICIRTHALSPSGDRRALHKDVLDFLRGRDIIV